MTKSEPFGGNFILIGERAEDLEYQNLRILQKENGYRFTSDSVLLAGLAEAKKTDRVVDLGTGSGVIATLLAARTGAEVWGVEIQESLADMARRSVLINGIGEKVHIVCCDMREAHKILKAGSFDVAVSNPPYFLPTDAKRVGAASSVKECADGSNPWKISDASAQQSYGERELARFEILVNLKEVIRSAKNLLKHGGTFFVVSKAERLTDLLTGLREAGLEPKSITPIQPKPSAAIDTVVVKAVKGGKPPLKFLAPFVVYGEDGKMTEQTRRIYHK